MNKNQRFTGQKWPEIKKLLLVMKLTAFLLLLSVMAIAAKTYSQATRFDLKVKDATVIQVFDEIERVTDFGFLFKTDQLDLNRHFTLDIKKAYIDQILNEVLEKDQYTYTVIDRNIVITRVDSKSGQPGNSKKVTGKVTDSGGASIPGVSVVVKGTTTGTISDGNGNFSLSNVSENTTLQFSFVGMKMQEIIVGKKTSINVVMVEETIKVDEVVAIGYGTVRKVDVTSAISTVGSNDLKNKSMTSLEQGMQGVASGVQVTQNSGEPGAGLTVRVRGSSSISAGNDPLYVIDGVPFLNNPRALNIQGYQQTGWLTTETAPPNAGMSAINPSDIESIQVLKDASATAIYGNRGANGVILITTKKGKAGESRINFDMSQGWQSMTRPVGVLESKDYVTFNHEALDYYASIGQSTTEIRLPDAAANVNTNWQKECTIKNAPSSDYNLSFSGGNQNITYFISGNYQKQDGIVPQTGFSRKSLRANIDAKVNEKFNVGMDMTTSYAQTDGAYFNEGNIGTQFLTLSPVVLAYNPDGSLNHINPYPALGSATNTFGSPIRSKDNPMIDELHTGTFRTIGNINLSYKIIKDLTFRSSYGVDFVNIMRQQWRPKNIYYANDADGIGRAFVSNLRFPSYVLENRLNWDKTVKDHVINVTLAQAMEWHNRFSSLASSFNFNDNNLKYNDLTAGSLTQPTQTNQKSWQLVSFIGRVNYAFKSKFLASASLRADGSSKFANNPFGFFPALSGAWRLSEEPFVKGLGIFSDLKLRGGWGATGNDDIDPYQTLLTYGVVQYPIGGVLRTGVKPNIMPYPDLTWEKTYMTSGGVDLGIFNGRISLTAEYYYKKTVDLLLNVNIPSISGFPTMLQNIGSVENKGVDLSLVTRNIESSKFRWTTKFNFSTNKNKVLKLTGAKDNSGKTLNYIEIATEVASTVYRIQEGHALGEFYDYQYGGVFKDAADLASQKIKNVGIGSQKTMDLSGPNGRPDSLISVYDKIWVGNPNPKFILGIENQLSYEGVTLGFFINSVYGNTIIVQSYGGAAQGPALKKYFDRRWTPTNTNTDVPRPGGGGGNNYWDGSFVRLQYVTLSYDLPSKLLDKIKVKGLRVYVTGKNLFLISGYGGYDPEVSSSGNNALMQGIDRNGYPSSKTMMVGINLQL